MTKTQITQVTTLKRQATKVLKDLRKYKKPILITEHGVPAAYLIDVDTYHEEQERLELELAIMEGEKAIQEGRVIPHDIVMAELKKKYGGKHNKTKK